MSEIGKNFIKNRSLATKASKEVLEKTTQTAIKETAENLDNIAQWTTSYTNQPGLSQAAKHEMKAAGEIADEASKSLSKGTDDIAEVATKCVKNKIIQKFLKYLPVIAEVGVAIYEYIELGKDAALLDEYNSDRADNKIGERNTKTVVRLS